METRGQVGNLPFILLGRAAAKARFEAGKKIRRHLPRSHLGAFRSDGREPVPLLKASDKSRVRELVPIRYERMLASPFAFYRGAAALMAHDLGAQQSTPIVVQLCGDAHLANFGFFASPERRTLFGLNDFDETLPGPFDWDVRRLAASFAVAGLEKGFGVRRTEGIIRHLCGAFRREVHQFSEMTTLELWYYQLTARDLLAGADSRAERVIEEKVLKKALQHTSEKLAGRTVERRGKRLRIRDEPPHVFHVGGLVGDRKSGFSKTLKGFFRSYRISLSEERRVLFDRFRLEDAVVRVVGVGSVGTRCFAVLFAGDDDEPLFLQIKEAGPSALENRLPRSQFKNAGERVVVGQRLLQSASDIFLGWGRSPAGRDFYVRQLRDRKSSFDIASFTPRQLGEYAESCGRALAHSLSKSGDPSLLSGYIGRSEAFDEAITTFAMAYAKQNEADYAAACKAAKAGKLPVRKE